MFEFESFDPLEAKQIANSEVAAHAVKREIENILTSYVGWFDPFCELIQNALDAVDEKSSIEQGYLPKISITIDVQNDRLTVSDNGIGLTNNKFRQFLAPCFSFKSGVTRGHKGVGATYLAYGFNFITISTKSGDFNTTGKMTGARNWLSDPSPSGNPELTFDPDPEFIDDFPNYASGVSITVGFDSASHPKQLRWLKANTAEVWKIILLTKTGLGAFFENREIDTTIRVISEDASVTEENVSGTEYFWPYHTQRKAIAYLDLKSKMDALLAKHGPSFVNKIPSSLKKIEAIFDRLNTEQLISMIEFDEDQLSILERYTPEIHFTYLYTAKVWKVYNESLDIRGGQSILYPGIQIFANNMPQGEMIEIPLKRNIGRQRQIFLGIHFNNCKPDLGRKGFQTEVVQIAKYIGQRIIESLIPPYKPQLRVSSGVAPDLFRQNTVSQWKKDIEEHENAHPLDLTNENFFLPIKSISITSEPTREQDVIALFNQLIAGGIIRGVKIMSTNERFTYDGMYKVSYEPPGENHIYEEKTNPLGVVQEYVDEYTGFISEAKILEYKFSLDGLIENIEDGTKNSNDISLVVVWETGEDYLGNYVVTSLIDPDNLSEREYHGVTHAMTNLTTGQKEMDLIVLKELISFLNQSKDEIDNQREKYDS